MTTFPITHPEDRKHTDREDAIIRQANLVTRISASTIGIHTEPTPRQQHAQQIRRRTRRARIVQRFAQLVTYSVIAGGFVACCIIYANLLGNIRGY